MALLVGPAFFRLPLHPRGLQTLYISDSVSETRRAVGKLPRPIGFVPTMGALHAGHIRLLEVARKECASVVGSLFVNPLQFGPNEDLQKYPRDIEGDKQKFTDSEVDVLFCPSVDEMYPREFSTTVDVGKMGTIFEGAIRLEHFRGVATVVVKLLNIVQPDVLYLGQKDAQQTAVLRKIVRDLAIPTEIRIVPTVRESDGLAMSSRNIYLSEAERAVAPNLYRMLEAMRREMVSGKTKSQATTIAVGEFATTIAVSEFATTIAVGEFATAMAKFATTIPDSVLASCHSERSAAGAESRNSGNVCNIDYVDVVDADTFEPIDELRAPVFIIGAVRFGATRLIDNLWIAA